MHLESVWRGEMNAVQAFAPANDVSCAWDGVLPHKVCMGHARGKFSLWDYSTSLCPMMLVPK